MSSGWLLPRVTAALPPGPILRVDHKPPTVERNQMHYLLDAQYSHAVAWQKTQRAHAFARQQLPARRGLVRLRAVKPADPQGTKPGV
jgi:hypothetical protein